MRELLRQGQQQKNKQTTTAGESLLGQTLQPCSWRHMVCKSAHPSPASNINGGGGGGGREKRERERERKEEKEGGRTE